MVAAAPHRRSRATVAAVGILVVGLGTWSVLHFTRAAPAGPAPASNTDATASRHRRAADADDPVARPVPPPAPVPVSVPASPVKKEVHPITTAAKPVEKDTVIVHDTVVAASEADTAAPNLRALESPVLRRMGSGAAMPVLESPSRAVPSRAAAAAFLGQVALEAQKRDTALALFRMAYRWQPRPAYLKIIRQLGDTVTP